MPAAAAETSILSARLERSGADHRADFPDPGHHQTRAVQSTGKKVGVPSGVTFFGSPVLLTARNTHTRR
jgi:hypothetical protein